MANPPDRPLIPIPDPTALTTVALRAAIDSLKEFLIAKIESGDAILDEKIKHNGCLDEKRHRETREWLQTIKEHRIEVNRATEVAIDKAFEASRALSNQQRECSEEATKKQSESFTKQLDSLSRETKTELHGLNDKITELKTQVDQKAGKETEQKDVRNSTQWIVGLIVAMVMALAADIIMLMHIFMAR